MRTLFWTILLSWIAMDAVYAADCSAAIGNARPAQNKNSLDTSVGTYFLACDGIYRVGCCGLTRRNAVYVGGNGEVTSMVWRPVGAGRYIMVASASFTVTDGGEKRIFTTYTNPASIQEGDCMGWYAPGTEMVKYKAVTGASGIKPLMLPDTGIDTSGTVNWSGATEAATKAIYAINLQVDASIAPIFATAVTETTISDASPSGTQVFEVTFTDDLGDIISLSETHDHFQIFSNNGTGTIVTSGTDLASLGASTILTVTATDTCGKTSEANFTINFISSPPPTLSGLAASSSVNEDIDTATLLTSFTCSDGEEDVEASITSITPSNPDGGPFFYVQHDSGTARDAVYGIYARSQSVAADGVFDFNSQEDYILVLECTDGTTAIPAAHTVNLVQNQAPQITNIASTSIEVAKTTGNDATIFTVQYSDNEGDTPITLTSSCNPGGCPFTVENSGAIKTTSSLAGETETQYEITITPADHRNSGTPQTLTVVFTEGFVFTNLPDTIDVDENIANPTTVFTVSYSGIDAPATATFSTGASLLFDLNPATGTVTSKADINYEALADKQYTLDIALSDGSASKTETLTINIVDVNEDLVWDAATYTTNVAENAGAGTVLTDPGFSVTDPDAGDTHTCSMNCAANDAFFALSGACVLTVVSEYSLDAGASDAVVCTVYAEDTASHTATATLTINVDETNDFTPAFANSVYSFTVATNAGANTAIGTAGATDGDVGNFGVISYALDQSGIAGSYFKIDGSGRISTQVDMATSCDCTGSTLTVLAVATDTGSLATTSTVSILVEEATTPTVSNTTDRYKTFLEDPKTIAWVAPAIMVLAATILMTIFVCLKYCLGRQSTMKPHRGSYNMMRDDPRYPRQLETPPHQKIRNQPPRGYQPRWTKTDF